MEYFNLILGVVLVIAFTWILIRNSKRSGLLHSLLRIDTIGGIVGGLYLVFASVFSLWIQ
ncbi:MAG: hypothetical protein ACKVOQ_17785 [Cyclobacteriaceae bacterium]